MPILRAADFGARTKLKCGKGINFTMPEIAASVLNADLSKWKEWLPELEKSEVDRIQLDIMDNKFVPNSGVPKSFPGKLRPYTKIFLEAHLMVQKPENYIKQFSEMGCDLLIFHVEAAAKPFKIIHLIEDAGMRAGLAVNRKTRAEKIFPYLDDVGLALVMGVDAGFGGQKFSRTALEKISRLRKKIDSEGMKCEIEVDGGINLETGKKCVKAGADVLVAGTYIFKHPKGIPQAIAELRGL